jgi:hypothetical protein
MARPGMGDGRERYSQEGPKTKLSGNLAVEIASSLWGSWGRAMENWLGEQPSPNPLKKPSPAHFAGVGLGSRCWCLLGWLLCGNPLKQLQSANVWFVTDQGRARPRMPRVLNIVSWRRSRKSGDEIHCSTGPNQETHNGGPYQGGLSDVM